MNIGFRIRCNLHFLSKIPRFLNGTLQNHRAFLNTKWDPLVMLDQVVEGIKDRGFGVFLNKIPAKSFLIFGVYFNLLRFVL